MKKYHLFSTTISVFMFLTLTLTSCGDIGTGILYGLASVASAASGGYGYYADPGYTSTQTNFVAPSYSSSSSSTYSSSSSSSSSTQNKRKCAYCKNGRVEKNSSVPTFGLDDPKIKCDECGKTYHRSTGHYHVNCSHCGGTGYVK